jgi:hypothetical protein
VILIALGLFTLYGLYQQVVNHHPFGEKPATDAGLLISGIVAILIALLLLIIRLETQVKKDGVYVRFFPFQLVYRHYSWDKMLKCYVRKYKPMIEFGGWGLRFGVSGKAYSISGNQGLQLQFSNNKKLLIGTQKPGELSEVLKKEGRWIT